MNLIRVSLRKEKVNIMRKIMKVASGFISTALLFGSGTMPASADTVESAVSGGTLAATTASPSMGEVTLDGTGTQTSSGTSTAWSIVDARGTGAEWTMTMLATAFTSAAGSTETVARTIAVGKLGVVLGDVTAGTGSDAITNITKYSLTLTTSAQTLIASSGTNKGIYAVTPTFTLTIPANSFRSNYAVDSSGAQNPYISTITYSIA